MGRRALPTDAGLTALFRAIRAYAHHDDPLVAAANLIALVVVSNQPFYPLYVWWVVGPEIAPTYWTFLSTPFFLAVPAVSRFNPLAGRALLPLTGIANAALSAWAFGVASGVELFLIPCVLIGFALFRPRERPVRLVLAALAFAVYALRDRYGAPFHVYTAEEYAGFLSLNAISVATLTAFVGLILSGIVSAQEPK